MKLKEGYLYHIKDEFFEITNDKGLMLNHEKGNKRPTYFVIKENELLWLSSKVEKYKKIVENKNKKYGFCNTILIQKILNKEHAILLQNAFPILESYIDHIHKVNGKPIKVINSLKEEIYKNFKELIKLKNQGINLFFTDVDRIKTIMLKELIKK